LPPAFGQIPDRSVRVIVPFTPAGTSDIVARILVNAVSADFPRGIFVENKGGAGGNLGTVEAARAIPDGTTLVQCTIGTCGSNPAMYASPGYDLARDFTPVILTGAVRNVMTVRKDLPAANLQEVIALAKAQPGKLNFASAGIGGLPHLAGELFKLTAKIDIVHVPYRGAAPAINDLLGQQVQMTFLDLPVILPHIKAGSLKPIALGSPTRAPTAPDVPTTAEVGMPDLLIENWYGMIAPGGTPAKIIAELNRITNEAMADPGVKAKLADQGLTVAGDTPEHFRAFIESETKKWAKVIKDAGLETAK
jgi:tripartite-type tricarboxylate transporter receptor subunit TctC